MPVWNPMGWNSTPSKDRLFEMVAWERDTIQPKYGINHGVEYTHTIGVAELYDYEWYFTGFPWKIHDVEVARRLGVELEQEVVYFPRRASTCGTPAISSLPFGPTAGATSIAGTPRSLSEATSSFPILTFSAVPKGSRRHKNWVETHDYQIMRNESEFPRSWVVHDARATIPVTGLSRDSRSEAMQEILYAADPIWNDSAHHAYDPRRARVGSE